jgi:hypothetical protein
LIDIQSKTPNGPHRVYEGEREVIKENEKKINKKGKMPIDIEATHTTSDTSDECH